ncbi:MAG: radical SAM protein [Armatimonadota bacterium]|nr:radical SAM protein [Armatimonadota bacterium]MDR7485964.1 radical SAM protein [Armatimonadota bacterium]MDR7532158.1 radical SAM protein [Armatimonadota bacterium]MDR7537306.1 radical SAM protein [Armatimonadota bacterium]
MSVTLCGPVKLARAPDEPMGRRVRLFRPTAVRVTPQVEWVEVEARSVLNRVQGMPFRWSINPYRGCQHRCVFCYARRTHWFLDQDGVADWGTRIFVKVNAPAVLRCELARPGWAREEVHIGTATDPYQPAEGVYRLTRQILEALRDFRTPASVVTRSTMVVRDRDLLRQLADGPGATVCLSIATVDAALAREIEPDVPPPRRRLDALRALAEAGIPVGVLLAPVLPGLTDAPDHLAAVVDAARANGARWLWTNTLHLGDVTRQAFFQYLQRWHPELVPGYETLYRGKYAPGAYQRRVQEVVAAIKRRAGFAPRADLPSRASRADPPSTAARASASDGAALQDRPTAAQLPLF